MDNNETWSVDVNAPHPLCDEQTARDVAGRLSLQQARKWWAIYDDYAHSLERERVWARKTAMRATR